MDMLSKAGLLLFQLAAGMIALAMLALSPPARGRMLLLSISGTAGGRALQVALEHGAGLVGRGPLPGSLIISGDITRLAGPLRAVGALLVAAPEGCGEDRK